MAPFIANQIIRERKISLEKGQAKYYAYFVNTHLYLAYKADVDAILEVEGMADAIV